MYGKHGLVKLVALAAALAPLAFASVQSAEPPHARQHEAVALAGLKLNGERKWPTDEPLRQGMANIRKALGPHFGAIHQGTAAPRVYQALAARIEAEVAGIVRNCKLDPEADAMLHLVLADLLQGVEPWRARTSGSAGATAPSGW